MSDEPGRRLGYEEHEDQTEKREDTAEASQDSPMNMLQRGRVSKSALTTLQNNMKTKLEIYEGVKYNRNIAS